MTEFADAAKSLARVSATSDMGESLSIRDVTCYELSVQDSSRRVKSAEGARPHMHRPDHVIVRRAWGPAKKAPGRRAATAVGWTLHKSTCSFARRALRDVQPAPMTPYANTVACRYCKPEVTPRGIEEMGGPASGDSQ